MKTGAFLRLVLIYSFEDKDPNEKLTVGIRTMELGNPTTHLFKIACSKVTLNPSEINVSNNAEGATKVQLPISSLFWNLIQNITVSFTLPQLQIIMKHGLLRWVKKQ